MTVQITRLDCDAACLRQRAAHVAEAAVARRLLAVALVLEGHSRMEAARNCGMDRQTLRDWVIRYNEQGIAGLSDRPHGGGAPPKLSVEEKTQLAAWVRQGPDIAEDGVVRGSVSARASKYSSPTTALTGRSETGTAGANETPSWYA